METQYVTSLKCHSKVFMYKFCQTACVRTMTNYRNLDYSTRSGPNKKH